MNKFYLIYERVLKRLVETIEEEDATKEECYEEDELGEMSTVAGAAGGEGAHGGMGYVLKLGDSNNGKKKRVYGWK